MKRGFTIVELLIVIVVIAILAAITVVAFNGVQQNATNSKTQTAVSAWIRAINLYKTDNSRWPNGGFTCLGEGYLYGPTGTDPSGVAQCRQTTSGTGLIESSAFKTLMRPYFNGGALPNPSFVTAFTSDTQWLRGITYVFGGGTSTTEVYIQAAFRGTGSCSNIAGVAPSSASVYGNNNTSCQYMLGQTTDR